MKRIARRFVGWMADFFPWTYFYGPGLWRGIVRNVFDGNEHDARESVMVALAAMSHERLPDVGCKLTATLCSVTSHGRDIGHFRVTVERISEDAASGETQPTNTEGE